MALPISIIKAKKPFKKFNDRETILDQLVREFGGRDAINDIPKYRTNDLEKKFGTKDYYNDMLRNTNPVVHERTHGYKKIPGGYEFNEVEVFNPKIIDRMGGR